MDQISQRAFISAVAKGFVEPSAAASAKHAAALRVQRKTVAEGGAAVEAEIFGDQRRRLSQALITNGNAR
jgi:hypothetical protein